MRGISGLAIGGGLAALALGLVTLEGTSMPGPLRWFVGITGAVIALASIAHLRLRWLRHLAYSNGREKRGIVCLQRPIHPESDSATAFVTFATNHAEWVMTLDLGSIKGLEEQLVEGLPAKAWLGNDDHIYALNIGDRRTLPISAGIPLDHKLKEKFAEAEARMANIAKKRGE